MLVSTGLCGLQVAHRLVGKEHILAIEGIAIGPGDLSLQVIGDCQAVGRDPTVLQGRHLCGQIGAPGTVGLCLHQAALEEGAGDVLHSLGPDVGVEQVRLVAEAQDHGSPPLVRTRPRRRCLGGGGEGWAGPGSRRLTLRRGATGSEKGREHGSQKQGCPRQRCVPASSGLRGSRRRRGCG